MAELQEILDLTEVEADRFRSEPIPTELPRTFGGQVAAQSLLAAGRTVDGAYRAHSMHAYFLRPGRPDQSADHVVERLRDGRSLHTRRVTTVQSGVPIFTMTASFHRGDDGFAHQAEMPEVPSPEEIAAADRASGRRVPQLGEWHNWEQLWVPRKQVTPGPESVATQRVWMRYHRPLPDDQVLHTCALTYLSDMSLLRAAVLSHPVRPLQGASLDHALWFLRPFRADDWLLYDQSSPSAESGRALVQGRLFDRDGRLVAIVAQEGMLRFDNSQPLPGTS